MRSVSYLDNYERFYRTGAETSCFDGKPGGFNHRGAAEAGRARLR